MNSGGSPMEGNNWEEISPGVFRTGRPTFRFSPMDLYAMGLLPASAVPPLWLITQPDVMNQRDQNGHVIFRESPTEYSGRTITIRGQRVTYTIDDIIRANGPRVPAYSPSDADAGTPDDAGAGTPTRPGDLSVMWVLLTTADRVTPALANAFDDAIESCTSGYDGATGDRSHLIAQVVPQPEDAGADDAGSDASGGDDASAQASDAAGRDGAAGDAGAGEAGTNSHAVGGCGGCVTTPARDRGGRATGVLFAGLAAAAVAGAARRRRTRVSPPRSARG